MKTFEMTMCDGQNLLSELDLNQIESIVCLRLAPVRENVQSVDFQFRKNSRSSAKESFAAKISTKLKSGKIVHVEGVCDDQLESILLATDQMGKHVRNRVGFESSMSCKAVSFVTAFLDKRVVNLKRRTVNWMLAVSEPLIWLLELQRGCNRENPQL